ncbi:hypothetical protein A2635_05190 [Candidatus Peribacteria bacterium RIFCSPHIGHO2_01_FULL_51_9]|nr:MAG: hypothetical protein A2635_05190 [Candidatus Peribacteria bacterium RIFCSPHIGHO2_01_FULL_51_9]
MPLAIHLQPDQLRLVQTILQAHIPGRQVCAFGSRVLGTAKPASDLDLCIMGEDRLPPAAIDSLRFAFSDSVLPMKVDVVEWAGLKENFRRIIRDSSLAV